MKTRIVSYVEHHFFTERDEVTIKLTQRSNNSTEIMVTTKKLGLVKHTHWGGNTELYKLMNNTMTPFEAIGIETIQDHLYDLLGDVELVDITEEEDGDDD